MMDSTGYVGVLDAVVLYEVVVSKNRRRDSRSAGVVPLCDGRRSRLSRFGYAHWGLNRNRLLLNPIDQLRENIPWSNFDKTHLAFATQELNAVSPAHWLRKLSREQFNDPIFAVEIRFDV